MKQVFGSAAIVILVCVVGCQSFSPRWPSKQAHDTALRDEITAAYEQLSQSQADRGSSVQQASFESESGAADVGAPVAPTSLADDINRGHDEVNRQNWQAAKASYWQALQKQPDHPAAHHQLAIIADKQDDFRAAEFHYQSALRTSSSDPNLLSDLGYSYFLQQRHSESEDYLRQALTLDPTHAHALNNLSQLYLARVGGSTNEGTSGLNSTQSQGSALRPASFSQHAIHDRHTRIATGRNDNLAGLPEAPPPMSMRTGLRTPSHAPLASSLPGTLQAAHQPIPGQAGQNLNRLFSQIDAGRANFPSAAAVPVGSSFNANGAPITKGIPVEHTQGRVAPAHMMSAPEVVPNRSDARRLPSIGQPKTDHNRVLGRAPANPLDSMPRWPPPGQMTPRPARQTENSPRVPTAYPVSVIPSGTQINPGGMAYSGQQVSYETYQAGFPGQMGVQPGSRVVRPSTGTHHAHYTVPQAPTPAGSSDALQIPQRWPVGR